ncbi:unnamed protein product, partial [Oikopleura dioica]
ILWNGETFSGFFSGIDTRGF